ncbi:MAG: flagellar export protein FliJ [Rhodospirillaceae bacterium]
MPTTDLKAVIRLRKWEVDEKRRVLGEMIAEEALLRKRRVELKEEVLRENECAREFVHLADMTLGSYAARAYARRLQLNAAIVDAKKRIEQARDELADMFKDLKTLELAQEARDEAERKERNRKEQLVMDEIGLELFRRREGDSVS